MLILPVPRASVSVRRMSTHSADANYRARKIRCSGADAPAAVCFNDYRILAGVRARGGQDYSLDTSPLYLRMVGKPRRPNIAPSFLYRSVQSHIGDVKRISIPTDKKFR